MSSVKETLLEQFNACYDENGWFVALKSALKNLSAADAARRVGAGRDNSIWEIARHLNFYNEAYLKRFKGIAVDYAHTSNDETFSIGAQDVSEAAWQAEIQRLDAIMTEWRGLLAAADEGKFDEAVSATNKASWATILALVNAHNAHHGGQIVVIRKLQGSWDADKGVS